MTKIKELSSLISGFDALGDFEELVEKNPDFYFNLANTAQPFSPVELSEVCCYGDKFKGLNLALDCFDREEIEELWAFTKIEYLRLSFTDCDIESQEFSSFQSWLLQLSDLKAVVISNLPTDKKLINYIVQSLSVHKPYPLTVIYDSKIKRKKTRKGLDNNILPISESGNANIYQAAKVILTEEGIRNVIQNGKRLRCTSSKELQYAGHLEVETGDWTLNVISLYFDEFKEIVVTLEGFDEDGKFSCMCRCEWHDVEGGFYFASRIPINYAEYKADSEVISLKFNRVRIDSSGHCDIEGFWLQGGEEWAIDGKLTNVSTSKLIETIELANSQ